MSSPELLSTTRRALLHRLAVAQVDGRLPSLVGGVVRDGGPAWSAARGEVDGDPPTVDTQYRIGSLTKTFVAVLVLRLRDEGRLRLGDPLEEHLPGTGVGHLRVGQLLAHTSGLASEAAGPWWERTPGTLRPTLADVLGPDPVRHPPGRRFHYSNPGYAALGELVAALRGVPWHEALRREVLEPLGMTRTTPLPRAPYARGWAVHPWADVLLPEPAQDTGVMGPAGQLWSTVADLRRFMTVLAGDASEVLGADSAEEMRAPAGPPEAVGDVSYGLGVQLRRVDGATLIGHTGSMPGYLAVCWVDVARGLGSVVLANATSGVPVGGLGADLIGIVAAHEPVIPEPWRPAGEVDPAVLALTGPWFWGPEPYVLRWGADRILLLEPLSGGGRRCRFRAVADGAWRGLDGYHAGERLRVVRDESGEVTHLDVGSFVFTREPYGTPAAQPGGVDPAGWSPAG